MHCGTKGKKALACFDILNPPVIYSGSTSLLSQTFCLNEHTLASMHDFPTIDKPYASSTNFPNEVVTSAFRGVHRVAIENK